MIVPSAEAVPSMKRSVAACNVYISEHRAAAIAAVKKAILDSVAGRGASLAASFTDAAYNRSSFSIAGEPSAVSRAAVAACNAAIAFIDLRTAPPNVQHPRVGACDHIAFYPLQAVTLPELAAYAQGAAAAISDAHPTLPVMQYGTAHPAGLSLAAMRRSTRYFSTHREDPEPTAALAGQGDLPIAGRLGPAQPCPAAGMLTLGCVPFVLSFNVPLQTVDIAAGRTIASAVRERGGGATPRGAGLPCVEALALRGSCDKIEIATNLLDLSITPAARVLERVCELAREAGINVDSGAAYGIGLSQEELLRCGQEAHK